MAAWRCTVCKKVFEGEAPPVPCPVCGAPRDAFEPVDPPAPAKAAPFQKNTDDHFVIIGGGVAGLEAARAIRARNATAAITIVSGEKHLPYNRPGLPSVISAGKGLDDLVLERPDFYTGRHIELMLGTLATAVDPKKKAVTLSNGQALPYTGLLLATGANPFNPIESGHGAAPVKVLRCYEDAIALAEFSKGRKVVLVGGGILGLEAAVALKGCGAEVTVVEFAPRILPIQTDETVSRMLADALQAAGITLLCGTSVEKAVPGGALLAGGATLPADLILASMGVRSEMSLAVAIGLELARGIVVDNHMRTSRADIWAAGDCAEYNGRVLALASTARAMGAMAGASMAGDDQLAYQPIVPATLFSLPGLSLFSAGAVGSAAEGAETLTHTGPEAGRYGKLLFEAGRLSGVLFTGKNPGAAAIKALAAGASPAEAAALLVQ